MIKKYKYLFLGVFLIALIFLIKSRHIPKDHFEIMVLDKVNQVYETCIEIHEAKIKGEEFTPDNDVKYLLSELGDNPCENKDSIQPIMERKIEQSLNSNWLFVF